MNKNIFIYLLFPIILASGGCVNKRLSLNQASTQYKKGEQEIKWEGIEAKKQIPAKSLRILVADETGTLNESPYREILIYDYDPFSKDTIIESTYYNKQVLKAFKEKLPGKANVDVFYRQCSNEELDSLIQAEKYDLVITAQEIKFNYKFTFAGTGAQEEYRKKSKEKNSEGGQSGYITDIKTGSSGTPPRYAENIPYYQTGTNTYASSMGSSFAFNSTNRQVPLRTHTITYHTCWNLKWINKEENPSTQQLIQEGTLVGTLNEIHVLLPIIVTQAGESFAQIFNW